MKRISGIIILAFMLCGLSGSAKAQSKDLLATNGEKVEKLRKMNPFRDKAVKQYVKDSLQTLVSRCEKVLIRAQMLTRNPYWRSWRMR